MVLCEDLMVPLGARGLEHGIDGSLVMVLRSLVGSILSCIRFVCHFAVSEEWTSCTVASGIVFCQRSGP